MNKKAIFVIVILAFIAIVISLTMNYLKEQKEKREAYLNTYVKYVPIILENPNIGYEEAPDLDIKQENLIFILDHFHEKWKIENGEIYITQKLALNKDSVCNYTWLAMDEKYIEQWK